MTIDEIIEVFQAVKKGKPLQSRERSGKGEWRDEPAGVMPYVLREWRIKPEPREWWIYLASNGLIYNGGEVLPCGVKPGVQIKVREVLE